MRWRESGRLRRDSSRSAEKLGELRKPGLDATPFWHQLLGFLLATDPSQRRQQVREGGLTLVLVPRPVRKTNPGMARQVKPGNDETVEEQGHRRRSCHRLG